MKNKRLLTHGLHAAVLASLVFAGTKSVNGDDFAGAFPRFNGRCLPLILTLSVGYVLIKAGAPLVVVGDLHRRDPISYHYALRAQSHLRVPEVTTVRAREARIAAHHRMNAHCDGRVIGATPVTLCAEPRALKVPVDRI